MSLNAVVSFGAFEGPALEDAKSQNYADLDGYMYYEFIFFGMIGVSSGWLAGKDTSTKNSLSKKCNY